jgi:hypothetical protein
MRWLAALMLLASASAYGQGASFLGLCNPSWPCQKTLATWGSGSIVTGWLEESFGARCRCADIILQQPQRKTIRVHLTNLTCMRSGRFCGRHEFMFGVTPRRMSKRLISSDRRAIRRFQKPLKRFAARIANIENLECYVSPSLESTLHESARAVLMGLVASAVPQCGLVDNIISGKCLPGTICEKHGPGPNLEKPCITDLDGVDGRTVNLKQYQEASKHCIISFYWEPKMNCIGKEFVLPNTRTCNLKTSFFKRIGATCQSLNPLSDTF